MTEDTAISNAMPDQPDTEVSVKDVFGFDRGYESASLYAGLRICA